MSKERDLRMKEELSKLDEEKEVYKSLDKDIKILFKKKKGLFKAKLELVDFEEPVMFLIRRNMSVEFKEGVKEGKYKFPHSDTEIGEMTVNLSPAKLLRFRYGDREFRGYIHFEDEFTTYPQTPLIDAETVKIMLDKIMNDIRTWKAKEIQAMTGLVKMIIIGIAVLVIGGIIYVMVKPPTPPVPQIAQNVSVIAQNISGATILG